ncbi:MAG: hypothetical protein KJZ86_11950 [Caldilineaceae bacterium]|nr:hypothetical protein [Caldilineaceae bacterium]
MNVTYTKLFRAPYGVPNAIQTTDEGLWIVDQITDRAGLVRMEEPSAYYGVPWLHREIPTESSNTSGLTWGDGSLWLAANGDAGIWRPARATDAAAHTGEILRVDPATGATQARYPIPGGGGTHGVEYDQFEPGHIWVEALKDGKLLKMRISDWSIQHVIELPYPRAHGLVQKEDGMWVVHTGHRLIIKLGMDGRELARIAVPESEPEPHCMTADGEDFLYCDAASGWVVRMELG